jgi:hypothetical protein
MSAMAIFRQTRASSEIVLRLLGRWHINPSSMEDATAEQVQSTDQPGKSVRQLLWFVPHLAAVYIIVNSCTPWLAGWTRGKLLPLLGIPTTSSSQFEFLFSHLLAFSFIPAFLGGLTNVRFKHRVAEFVWVVPAVVLAYKLATFSASTSVLASQPFPAFHQYFEGGFLIPEYRDWREFWEIMRSNPDMMRGMAQTSYTAPFYAGVGYSLGAWISFRISVQCRIVEKLTRWEERRFGNRT